MRIRPVAAAPDFRLNLRIVSLATVVLGLLVLAVLQYRWIDEVSDAQENRAKSHLREEIRLVSDAFDTEVTRAALAFEIPAGPTSSMYGELEGTWDAWNHDARWPRIVSGLSFLESANSGWRVRQFGEPAHFDVRSILPAEAFGASPRSRLNTGDLNQDLFVDGNPSLFRPLPSLSEPLGEPRINWVLIRFNEKYLADAVFPQLLEKYSTDEDRVEFQFEVRARRSPAASGDIMFAELFHYRPDCLTKQAVALTAMLPGGYRTHGAARSANGISTSSSGPVLRSDIDQATPLNTLLQTVGHCQMPLDPSGHGLMQLVVRHRQGPTSAVFTRFRRRNEIVSGAVMATLLVALAVLIVSTERARKLARLQTVVAAGISHELRTPLASLRVAADDLKSGHVVCVEQARRYGEIIDAQSRRLGHVVDQALALTGPTANSAPCLRAVSVPEILGAAVNALAPRLSAARIEVEKRMAPDVPRILADPELVLRCLTNLVENSIKYAGSEGWLLLSARAGRHLGRSVVELSVEDHGPGIPDDEANAVFEAFYRGASARQTREPGSGLGLAIVKSAVEAQGGWIKLERAVPNGCKFRMFFPAEDHASVHSAESEAAL
ncbi:MAG: HAMP domain-containing sensor histidine kinase [Bryobacteraceae bacterium]|jgi:signal transduction histidine kinase